MAIKMKTVKVNFSGNRKLQTIAMNMLAVAELYSLTMLSSFLRIAATTRPPTLLVHNATNSKILTSKLTFLSSRKDCIGRTTGAEITWTAEATTVPYRYSQNCCSRNFSPAV